MKKLLTIAVVASVAIAGNAATALWNATGGNIFNGTGSTEASAKYSGTMYIFNNTVSQSSLYSAYAADKAYDFAANAAGVLSVSEGSIVTDAEANYFNYGTGGEKYSFYAVITSGDNIYFSNIVTDLTAGESETMPTPVMFKSQNNGSSTFSAIAPSGSGYAGAGHWSTASVPEPTCGLMILFGIGLLALKRKRV